MGPKAQLFVPNIYRTPSPRPFRDRPSAQTRSFRFAPSFFMVACLISFSSLLMLVIRSHYILRDIDKVLQQSHMTQDLVAELADGTALSLELSWHATF